jgi:hypothetical protein
VRRGFVMTFFDTDGVFVDVIGIANASNFKAEEAAMVDMASRVKILAAAAGAPPRASNTPPAAQPPAPPAAPQPPSARQPH